MDFSKFLDTGELSDVTVTVDGRHFALHKFPLFTKSDFFRTLARRSVNADGNGFADEQAGGARISLSEFPGGPETFQMVAAYCYNVKVDMMATNVCQLRCAAEFLQMTAPGNLAGAADRVLTDILTSAKMRRRLDVITKLLRQCQKLGQLAEQSNIVSNCLEAIVDSWLLTSRFSTRLSFVGRRSQNKTGTVGTNTSGYDPEMVERLLRLPLAWFAQLVRMSRDRCVNAAQLTSLVEKYITGAVNRHEGKHRGRRCHGNEDVDDRPANRKGSIDDDDADDDVTGNRRRGTRANEGGQRQQRRQGRRADEELNDDDDDDDDGEDDGDDNDDNGEEKEDHGVEGERNERQEDVEGEDGAETKNRAANDFETFESEPIRNGRRQLGDITDNGEVGDVEDLEEPEDDMTDGELCHIIDSLLLDIPSADYPIVADVLSPRWIIDLLTKTETIGCDRSRDVLLKLASYVSQRFDADELSQLEPDTFVGLVKATCSGGTVTGTSFQHVTAEEGDTENQPAGPSTTCDQMIGSKQVCRAVDLYLKSLSDRGDLTVDTFRRVVDSVPDECRTNDDTFFDVLRNLLASEKSSDMDESERQALLDSIDYNRLSETALQTALDSKLVPVPFIAKAALNLCSRLRADLDAANAVIRLRKSELDRQQLVTGAGSRGYGSRGDVSRRTTGYSGVGGTSTGFDRPDGKYQYRRTPASTYTFHSSVIGPSITSSSAYRTGTGSAFHHRSRRPTSTAATGTTSTSTSGCNFRSVPSLATPRELQLALDPLNNESSRYDVIADASGWYGGNGTSYYGCDVSEDERMTSSGYSRSGIEPLSLMSVRSSASYIPTCIATTSVTRTTSYVKRR